MQATRTTLEWYSETKSRAGMTNLSLLFWQNKYIVAKEIAIPST